jgi:hypothetical protein
VPEVVALVFLGVTMFLLVHDLGRPERVWRLLLAPNTKSWLVKGGWILGGFGIVTTASLVARWLGAGDVADVLRWVNVPLAVMASGYSAFLFAQCRGRDLWHLNGRWQVLFTQLLARAAWFAIALALVLGASVVWQLLVTSVFLGAASLQDADLTPTNSMVTLAPMTKREARRKRDAWIANAIAAGLLFVFAPLGAAAVTAFQLFHERRWVREGQEALIS